MEAKTTRPSLIRVGPLNVKNELSCAKMSESESAANTFFETPQKLSPSLDSQEFLEQARTILNLVSNKAPVSPPTLAVLEQVQPAEQEAIVGNPSNLRRNASSTWRCENEPHMKAFAERVAMKLEIIRADLWANQAGGSERGVALKLDDSLLYTSTLARHWSKTDLEAIKQYLQDRFTQGADWQLYISFEDPWNGEGLCRGKDNAHIRAWYSLHHQHSSRPQAIPFLCRRAIALKTMSEPVSRYQASRSMGSPSYQSQISTESGSSVNQNYDDPIEQVVVALMSASLGQGIIDKCKDFIKRRRSPSPPGKPSVECHPVVE